MCEARERTPSDSERAKCGQYAEVGGAGLGGSYFGVRDRGVLS